MNKVLFPVRPAHLSLWLLLSTPGFWLLSGSRRDLGFVLLRWETPSSCHLQCSVHLERASAIGLNAELLPSFWVTLHFLPTTYGLTKNLLLKCSQTQQLSVILKHTWLYSVWSTPKDCKQAGKVWPRKLVRELPSAVAVCQTWVSVVYVTLINMYLECVFE